MLQCFFDTALHAGAKKQILWWVATKGQLWKHDDLGFEVVAGLMSGFDDLLNVAVYIPDSDVQLGHYHSQTLLHGSSRNA